MHDLFKQATEEAAALLEEEAPRTARGYLLEADLEAALLRALTRPDMPAPRRRRRVKIPNWDPQPGQVDIVVPWDSDGGRPRYLAELKWCNTNKVFEALYDALKMVWAKTLPGIEGAYLICGAPVRRWELPVEAAELFTTGEADLAGLVERYADWWQRYILDDSSGRPTQAPELTRTEVIATAEVQVGDKQWRLVTISVEPVSESVVPFKDGIPQRFEQAPPEPEPALVAELVGEGPHVPERQVLEPPDQGPWHPVFVFSAKRDHRWRWRLDEAQDEPVEGIELADILRQLPFEQWTNALGIHLDAITAAFDALARVERVLVETEDAVGEERPSIELLVTVMTLNRNLEALLEELQAAAPMLLGHGQGD